MMTELNESDLEAARQIQMSLLPSSPLRLGSWEIAGRLLPVGECDYLFDYYPLNDERCVLSITWGMGGMGMPAGRFMSDLHALQRIHCNGMSGTPESMKRLSEDVLRSLGKLISMFYAEFDSKRGVLRYSNCGFSIPPILRRQDGSLVGLREGRGPLLGGFENVDFTEAQLSMGSGDSLLLYGLGLIRALDPLLIGFELDRLDAIWRRCAGAAPAEVIAAILDSVRAFRDRALLGSVEDLRGVSEMGEPCPLGNVEPFRMEAARLRDRPTLRDDIALVVLGQPSL